MQTHFEENINFPMDKNYSQNMKLQLTFKVQLSSFQTQTK